MSDDISQVFQGFFTGSHPMVPPGYDKHEEASFLVYTCKGWKHKTRQTQLKIKKGKVYVQCEVHKQLNDFS